MKSSFKMEVCYLLLFLVVIADKLAKAKAVHSRGPRSTEGVMLDRLHINVSSAPEHIDSRLILQNKNDNSARMMKRSAGVKANGGRINIHVKADDVEYSGEDEHIISDQEVSSFGLTDSALKEAAQSFTGQRPDDVYLKSPTPWGDLYQQYGWRQVHCTLRPYKGEILGYKTDPVILAEKQFVNNRTGKLTYNAGITQEVSQTVSNKWTKNLEVSVEQEFSYTLDIIGTGVEGSTTFSVTGNWGKEYEESKTVTVGSSSGVEGELGPGEGVLVILSATRGSMSVRVDYKATVDGGMAMNYGNKYNGHYFWKADINDVQDFMGSTKEALSSEVITYDFYSNSKIVVTDLVTQKLVFQFDTKTIIKP